MMFPATRQTRKDLNVYATATDFCAVFKAHSDDLYQLAFLLTADHEKAEQCFVSGLEDSVTENHVFKDWAHSWAKRAIVRNAIHGSEAHLLHRRQRVDDPMQFAGLAYLVRTKCSSPSAPHVLFVLASDEALEVDSPHNVVRPHEIQG